MSQAPTEAYCSTTSCPVCGNEERIDLQYDHWFREQVALGVKDADEGRLLSVEEVNASAEARIAQALIGLGSH